MSIANGQGFNVKLVTVVAGQVCENVLTYQNGSATERESLAVIMNDFQTDVVPAWINVLSDQAMLATVTGRAFDNALGTVTPPQVTVYNTLGPNASQALPPFVAARIQKSPNNTLIEPSTALPLFRPGWIRIAGCPESFQDNGAVSSVGLPELDDLATALLTFTSGSSTFIMTMQRQELPSGGDAAGTFCASLATWPFLGSQNTRKIVI